MLALIQRIINWVDVLRGHRPKEYDIRKEVYGFGVRRRDTIYRTHQKPHLVFYRGKYFTRTKLGKWVKEEFRDSYFNQQSNSRLIAELFKPH